MGLKRRDFIKGCATASVLMLPGLASAARIQGNNAALFQDQGLRIEKSIKAGFGGGFALRGHRQSDGLTYAEIEHHGNRYTVASTDQIDWKILNAI
ncbi:MAG: twin-arginine translocation signal domain-containing protein [Pusillimonas sp.]